MIQIFTTQYTMWGGEKDKDEDSIVRIKISGWQNNNSVLTRTMQMYFYKTSKPTRHHNVLTSETWKLAHPKIKMSAAGFEPARISPCELESHALDHSATLTNSFRCVLTCSVGISDGEYWTDVERFAIRMMKSTKICEHREMRNVDAARPTGYQTWHGLAISI